LYLGGGTPSTLEINELTALLEAVPGAPWAEATLEAAPGTLTPEKIRGWAALGINRVSLGVQSFVRSEIARAGRKHTAELVRDEVGWLRDAGIDRFNIDLIAGLSGQTLDSWRVSLDWVEKLEAPHVSVYMLEIDEDSRLGREILLGGRRFGATQTPAEELTAELYEIAVGRLGALGIPRYEISNFARPGFESLHNLKYWRLEPYAGFGADAHSFDGVSRRQNVESPREYVDRWRGGQSPLHSTSEARPGEERFFVGLRLTQGIRLSPDDWQRHHAAIGRFLDLGLLAREGDCLRLTSRGVLLSNEVFEEFLQA
jgi:oxygen-independent coproporphyrinogen-3 oxidase